MKQRARLFPLATAVFLLGCPQRTAVWLEPGSSRSTLAFVISNRRGNTNGIGIEGLRVDRCDANVDAPPQWMIVGTYGTASAHRIRYGQLPEGFSTARQPEALSTGCYRVTISGTGRLRFDVRSDGSVVESVD